MSAAYVDENLDCKPRPGPNFSTSAKISPEEGFLLSQADGRLTLREILQVLPFDKDKVGGMLVNLRRCDILVWDGGTAPPPFAATEAIDDSPPPPEPDARLDDDFDDFGFAEPAPIPVSNVAAIDEDLAAEIDDIMGDLDVAADTVTEESTNSATASDLDFGDILDKEEPGIDFAADAENDAIAEVDADLLEELEALDDDLESMMADLEIDTAAASALDDTDDSALIRDLDLESVAASENDDDTLAADMFDLDSELDDIGASLDELMSAPTTTTDDAESGEDLDAGMFDDMEDEEISDASAGPAGVDLPVRAYVHNRSDEESVSVPRTELEREEKLKQLVKRLRIQQHLLAKDDPFEALGVKGGSSDKDIRDAWHRLSRVFHPDRYYNLNLPDSITTDLNDIYGKLQEAYELIGTREARRAFMFQRRDRRIKTSVDKLENAAQVSGKGSPGKPAGLDAERLLELAEAALARGQYKSAITNFKLAANMSGKQEYASRAKLVMLLEGFESRLESLLDSDEPIPEIDVQRIEEVLNKIKDVLPNNALLMKKIVLFMHENSSQGKFTRELTDRLLKLNRLPDTLLLAARVYVKANLPQAALDLLEDAKQRDSNSADIKSLIKEIKRSMK